MQAATEQRTAKAKLSTVRGAWRMRVRKSKLPARERLVAYTLLEFMDEAGECFVRIETLCKASGLSRATVKRGLAELVRRRFVSRARDDKRLSWNFYARLTPRGVSATPRGRTRSRRGVRQNRRGLTASPRTGVSNRGLEPKTKLSAAPDPEPVADEAIERHPGRAASIASTIGPRTAPKRTTPPADSQLDKHLELRAGKKRVRR